MRDKLKEMLEEARELRSLGAMNDEGVQKIEALVEARELNKRITAVKDMSGEEIRAMRDRLGMSQSVLARAMGMSKESVSKWERNEIKPSGPALRILNTLDIKGLSVFLI
jgi:Predicted transcriptional regulator